MPDQFSTGQLSTGQLSTEQFSTEQFSTGQLRTKVLRLKDREAVHTWLDPRSVPGREAVSIVMTVPFTGDGAMVVTRLRRGIELPGGHVAPGDPDLESAARREAWEEARITLGPLAVTQVIRIEYQTDPPQVTHVVVYTGRVQSMPPFVRAHESSGRMVVSCAEFVEHYGSGSSEERQALVDEARLTLRSLPPS
jgi:8-oxo-dGTP diphosphatase